MPGKGHSMFVAVLFYLFEYSCSLKNVRVTIPHAIVRGETAVFMCDFDLEGDPLYSVKWYKGRSEFFRYTPKEENPIKIFKIDGLNIDLNRSNMTRITILSVEPSLSGKYNCEVSVDQSFHTEIVSGEMDVIETPFTSPTIRVPKQRYRVGERVEANCTSGRSKPPANITWHINDDLASPFYVLPIKNDHVDHTLVSTTSRLTFIVTTHFFRSGQLRIRCTANIHNLYHQDTQVVIYEDYPNVVLPPNYLNELDNDGHSKRSFSDNSSSGHLGNLRRLVIIISIAGIHIFSKFILR